MSETQDLTHFSPDGRARMVDVGGKVPSDRLAVARGSIRMLPATLERIQSGRIAKGDVLAVADVAAVMAAKRTPDIIPLCHGLALSGVDVVFSEDATQDSEGLAALRVQVSARCNGQTGVEMEAMTAASVALLTVYDMCKAIDRGMRIESIQLEEKRGGKSGVWLRTPNSEKKDAP